MACECAITKINKAIKARVCNRVRSRRLYKCSVLTASSLQKKWNKAKHEIKAGQQNKHHCSKWQAYFISNNISSTNPSTLPVNRPILSMLAIVHKKQCRSSCQCNCN